MVDETRDTFTATARTRIDAAPADVWNALTDEDLIPQYFFGAEVVTDWAVGSPIRFRGEWEGTSYEDKGRILRFEPERLLEYTHWSPLSGTPDAPENYHTLTYELTAADGGTELTLTQDNNGTEAAREHAEANWRTMLENLKRLVEA